MLDDTYIDEATAAEKTCCPVNCRVSMLVIRTFPLIIGDLSKATSGVDLDCSPRNGSHQRCVARPVVRIKVCGEFLMKMSANIKIGRRHPDIYVSRRTYVLHKTTGWLKTSAADILSNALSSS
jgi:hypothetical protein